MLRTSAISFRNKIGHSAIFQNMISLQYLEFLQLQVRYYISSSLVSTMKTEIHYFILLLFINEGFKQCLWKIF